MLGTENYSPALFLNYFLEFLVFFFLDSFSQQSYKTQLQNTALQAIEAEEQEHRISREERGIASSVCPMPGECV